MDTLRTDDAVAKHATDSGKPIIFKVHTLLVEDRVALAEVTPMTNDEKESFPPHLALLRRGGDEPWALVASGSSKESPIWVKEILADGANSDFIQLWSFYQKGAAQSPTSFLTNEDLDRIAILKAVRSTAAIVNMQKDLGKEILLSNATVKKAGEWAWVVAEPHTADRIWQGEPLSYLVQKKDGKWQIITGIPDTVLSADDSTAAYAKWRAAIQKRYPTLPTDLIPED